MGIVYFKDRFLEESECHVALSDRSFRFGDGIFETLLIAAGRIYDWDAHFARLQTGLKELRIAPLAIGKLQKTCQEVVKRNAIKNGYLRIIVSRGSDVPGAVGYLPKGCKPYMVVKAVEKPYPGFTPVRLWKSSYKAAFNSVCKTNNALLYTLAMLEASEHGCNNALLLDATGHMCETASGNLFWIKDDVLYTPETGLPFVAGTIRKKVLKLWKGKVKQGRFKIQAIQKADEVFMANTGTLIAPITAIEPLGVKLKIGKHTRDLRSTIDQEIRQK